MTLALALCWSVASSLVAYLVMILAQYWAVTSAPALRPLLAFGSHLAPVHARAANAALAAIWAVLQALATPLTMALIPDHLGL